MLCYRSMPDQVFGIPPMWGWLDIDTTVNVVLNRMRIQAERQRDVLIHQPEAKEDAKAVLASEDGGAVTVDNINKMKTVSIGGANPASEPWVSLMLGQWSRQAGNMDIVGGQGPGSDTLGQDQMLYANASRTLDDMVTQTHQHTEINCSTVLGFLWEDPTYEATTVVKVLGLGEVATQFNESVKEGNVSDLALSVELYSMQRFNPDIALRKWMSFLSGWIIPMAGEAKAQGLSIDFKTVTDKLAAYSGLDARDVLVPIVPEKTDASAYVPPAPMGKRPHQSPKTMQGDNRTGADMASRMANSAYQEQRLNEESPV
jgi:hypothetical protein